MTSLEQFYDRPLPFAEQYPDAPGVAILSYRHPWTTTEQTILGVDHAYTMQQAAVYEQEWARFYTAQEKSGRPSIILFEGSNLPTPEATPAACLASERGEVTLLAYLSAQYDVPVQTFEPTTHQSLEYTRTSCESDEKLRAEGYDLDCITLYLLLRQHRQWFDSPTREQVDFKSYIQRMLDRYQAIMTDWPKEVFEYERVVEAYYRLYPNVLYDPYDTRCRDFFLSESLAPVGNTTQHVSTSVIEDISSYCNSSRDASLISLFYGYQAADYNVFAMAGKQHVDTISSQASGSPLFFASAAVNGSVQYLDAQRDYVY